MVDIVYIRISLRFKLGIHVTRFWHYNNIIDELVPLTVAEKIPTAKKIPVRANIVARFCLTIVSLTFSVVGVLNGFEE